MINKRRYRTSKIREFIIEHIKRNITEYIVMVLILVIGIILGTFYINNTKTEQKQEISEYINWFVEDTYSGMEIDFNNLLRTSIFNNLITVIFLWISGLTVIGMPIIYLIIAIKGFCMGYTISAIIGSIGTWDGIKFVISTMLLQNLIIVPCILVLAVSGIKLYKSIIKDKRRENIKIEIFKYTIVATVIALISVLAAIVETYVSSNIFKIIFI
jgi:stage II sporulation protein M